MPLVDFKELMNAAGSGQYAVGYFESWNMESLLAVADAAENRRSPVILGFSGICLPNPNRVVHDSLSNYAALLLDVCRNLNVPTCSLFNESAAMDWVLGSVDMGFQLVMFTDENLDYERQREQVKKVVGKAHPEGVAVEAEITPLPGVGGDDVVDAAAPHRTDLVQARDMVAYTGVDALAVDIGQVHLHGRKKVHLDMGHLKKLKEALDVPLVLHAASSVADEDIVAAIATGISKINVGSNLKRAYFNAMRAACNRVGEDFNPYNVIGSGLDEDVMVAGRLAMQSAVEGLMDLFGSTGKG